MNAEDRRVLANCVLRLDILSTYGVSIEQLRDEAILALDRSCATAHEAVNVIAELIATCERYPVPATIYQTAARLKESTATPARRRIHDPNCEPCRGTGFLIFTRTIDGEEYTYSQKCPGPWIPEPDQPATEPRKQLSAAEREELRSILGNRTVKDIPGAPADRITTPAFIVDIENPEPRHVMNGSTAALHRAAEIEELKRRYGPIGKF